ncbi:MAG: hypothetical protein ICV83_23830 [Cytophagales bacterium]|nr:hypothetical protein [Cytophagales bacterium]
MRTTTQKDAAGTLEARLKNLQRQLGLEDDALLGPITLTRLESLVNAANPQVLPTTLHSLEVSRQGLDQLVQFEISSEAHYTRKLTRPTWPGGASGVTIGIGYDLGCNTALTIRNDWRGKIADAQLEDLVRTAGKKGEAARNLIAGLAHVKVPLEAARSVFYVRTLPRYAKNTRDLYPGVERLPADAQAMLLSLIFNRGTALEGPRRSEMKAIRPLVQQGDLAGIACQLRSMKRLWDPATLRGLHLRRDREAELVEQAARVYAPGEVVRI